MLTWLSGVASRPKFIFKTTNVFALQFDGLNETKIA